MRKAKQRTIACKICYRLISHSFQLPRFYPYSHWVFDFSFKIHAQISIIQMCEWLLILYLNNVKVDNLSFKSFYMPHQSPVFCLGTFGFLAPNQFLIPSFSVRMITILLCITSFIIFAWGQEIDLIGF